MEADGGPGVNGPPVDQRDVDPGLVRAAETAMGDDDDEDAHVDDDDDVDEYEDDEDAATATAAAESPMPAGADGTLAPGRAHGTTGTPYRRGPGRPRKEGTRVREWKFRMPRHGIEALDAPLPQLAARRQQLFALDPPVDLSPAEFQRLWPYVDNVWIRQHRVSVAEHAQEAAGADGGANGGSGGALRGRTEYYHCRLHPPLSTPRASDASFAASSAHGADADAHAHAGSGSPPAKRQRRRKPRDSPACLARMKAVFTEPGGGGGSGGGTGRVHLARVPHAPAHNHDLAHSDRLKRNSVVMDVARAEVMAGYMPASTFARMGADPAKLAAVGGAGLTRSDVRNSSAAWRLQHKGALQVHPGFRYDNGFGVVLDDPAAIARNRENFRTAQFPAPQPPAPPALALAPGPAPAPAAPPPLPAPPPQQQPMPWPAQPPGPTPPGPTPPPTPPKSVMPFPTHFHHLLAPYLPPPSTSATQPPPPPFPHVTLAYATSLDSHLSLLPGTSTQLSSPIATAMTHHLRAQHDALLIGVGTALADDPSANCRLPGVRLAASPRPVILDPAARWPVSAQSAVVRAAREKRGRAPWIVVGPAARVDPACIDVLTKVGGRYLALTSVDPDAAAGGGPTSTTPGGAGGAGGPASRWLSWEGIFTALAREGVRSVMVEGGATVLGALLRPEHHRFVASAVLTLAPRYLGAAGGAVLRPGRRVDEHGRAVPAVRFAGVRWVPLGDEDVVLCARVVGGATPLAAAAWGPPPPPPPPPLPPANGVRPGSRPGPTAHPRRPSVLGLPARDGAPPASLSRQPRPQPPPGGPHPLQAIVAYNSAHANGTGPPGHGPESGQSVLEQLRSAAAQREHGTGGMGR